MKKTIFAVLALLLFKAPAMAANHPLQVVASFSILGDIVKNIGGNAVAVTTLVGPDSDAHTYQPTPDNVKAVAHADLIFINGLGFEGWMPRLIQASGTHARVITVSDNLGSRVVTSPHGVPDPHAWQNPQNGRFYTSTIAAALEQAAPDQAKAIYQRALTYDAELNQIDQYIRAQFAGIPGAQRKIVTSHDAFGYFGYAYGIQIIAPVGLSTEAEPSAADVAKLEQQIKTQGIKIIFLENMANPALIKQIAKDTGVQIGGQLYTDSLSAPNGPAASYLAMFRANTALLKQAMRLR